MKQFQKGRFRIKLRRTEALKLKEGMEALEGTEWEFMAVWIIGKESGIYEGEWAMQPCYDQGWPRDWPIWIALGDLEAV